MNPEVRNKENVKRNCREKEKRTNPEIRHRESVKDWLSRRRDIDVRKAEAIRQTSLKRRKRTYTKFREKDTRGETPRRKRKRAPVSTTENALIFSTFICTCCNRLLNSTSVVKFVYEKYKQQENLTEKCRTNKLSADNQEFILNASALPATNIFLKV